MRLLLKDLAPFQLFSALAGAFRQGGVFDCERGERARAEALLAHGAPLTDQALLAEALRHDLLLAGRRRDLPPSLCFQEDEALRAILRARFHPVRGQSARRYPFDVLEFARTGAVVARETAVLYDPPACEAIGAERMG